MTVAVKDYDDTSQSSVKLADTTHETTVAGEVGCSEGSAKHIVFYAEKGLEQPSTGSSTGTTTKTGTNGNNTHDVDNTHAGRPAVTLEVSGSVQYKEEADAAAVQENENASSVESGMRDDGDPSVSDRKRKFTE